MSEKIGKIVKMINHGASSMSLYRKRNYYGYIASIDAEQRWQELGVRLKISTDKVTKVHT